MYTGLGTPGMLDAWTSLVLVSRPDEGLAVPGVHLDDQITLTAPLVPLVEDFLSRSKIGLAW